MSVPAVGVPLPSTIPEAVFATIARQPDAEAVLDGVRRVTYGQLGDLITASTRAMIAAGVGPGDRVAVWAPNGLRWILAALSAQCAGAALVPVNTRWKGSEAAQLLATAGATLLCTSVGFLGTDTLAMLDDDPTPLPALRRIVVLDGTPVGRRVAETPPVQRWDDFIAAGEVIDEATATARRNAVSGDDPSDVLFTSGTTGRPKGVVMHHRQTVRQFTDWCEFAGLQSGDRYLIVNPFFHMFGYKAGWLASLMRGATILPVAVFDVPAVLDLVEAERVTVLPGAPTIYRSILDHPGRHERDLTSLRVAVTGAADIPVALIEEIRAELPFTRVLTGYGLTEAGTATGSRPDDDATTVATTCGRAMPDLEVVIAGADGIELPRGETGELLVRGYCVMQGYLDDPAATAAAIDERGFLHTGDLAVMDEHGYVRIVGRLKDMIIVGGFNVYPAEVENLLVSHPAIGQAAVIGVPDARMGEVGMAFVVAKPGALAAGEQIDGEAVIAWARERLANYKVPRSIVTLDALPINAAGKVLKSELRDPTNGASRSMTEHPDE